MIRDPLYQQIVHGLNGQLDAELFERCAAALLRSGIPTLVPIRGGSDSGMDGAIADTGGTAFPLVCTTGQDVIGNFTRSLRSYVAHGGQRRKVVSATSQALTPRRRKNLEERAAELGFELIQIYEQAAFADRLYEHPNWRIELLGIAGAPPALSAIAPRRRPHIGETPIGRDDDLVWLRDRSGDRLVLGQPGIGKTFLLSALAHAGDGLFLLDSDQERIADALRSQRPKLVFVDDAHLRLERLDLLVQLRRELSGTFDIVATSWPGMSTGVMSSLRLLSANARTLERLSRDQIVDVIHAAGLAGPDPLVYEIVNQSERRPGLAVSLVDLCLRGGFRDVVLGEALSRNVQDAMHPVLGERGLWLLAAFAIGGKGGMSIDAVANFLGLSRIETTQAIASLAYGGFITEAQSLQDKGSSYVVRPKTLRHALVRDVFFNSPAPLPYQGLGVQVPDPAEFARTLVGARRFGATIPPTVLRTILTETNSGMAWQDYASLGRDEATWVVENQMGWLEDIAPVALHHAPETVIPRLLDQATHDERSQSQHPEHPLRQLEDWIQEAAPGYGQTVSRRTTLVTAAVRWLRLGGDPKIGVHALALALRPNFMSTSPDPGQGRRVRWTSGLLLPEELLAVSKLWPTAFPAIATSGAPDWSKLFDVVTAWAYPNNWYGGPLSDEVMDTLRSTATQMLADIVKLAPQHTGVCLSVRSIAHALNVPVSIHVPDDVDALFGRPDSENAKGNPDSPEPHDEAIRVLAVAWVEGDVTSTIARIVRYEQEVDEAGYHGPRRIFDLAMHLSHLTDTPAVWLKASIDAGVSARMFAPFFARVVTEPATEWEHLATDALAQPPLQSIVVSSILEHPSPPEGVLMPVLDLLPEHVQMGEALCWSNRVPIATLKRLLQHPNQNIAGAAALGEWHTSPKGQVRTAVGTLWRRAITRSYSYHRPFAEILRADPGIAHDWLRARILMREIVHDDGNGPFAAALDGLDREGRSCILVALRHTGHTIDFVARLIGNDLEMFSQLLDDSNLESAHLAPLANLSCSAWRRMAQTAIMRGAKPRQIGEIIASPERSWTGDMSSMWTRRIDSIEPFARDEDPDIRAVVDQALRILSNARDDALASERREAIYGN